MQPVRTQASQITLVGAILIATAAGGAACGSNSGGEGTGTSSQEAISQATTPTASTATAAQLLHGRNVWLKATFGGEEFFSVLLPEALGLNVGLNQVLTTPRSQRFTTWGVVNDPNCTDGTAATGGLDICPPDVAAGDPDAAYEGAPSGVVGVREFPNPAFNAAQPPSATNSPILVGVSCAGCHAGLDAQHPPADPNHPTWANIALTTGNQYIQIGKIFGANLPPTDPRWQVFNTWAPGTVDTTAIESDGINNPGIITQFFDFPDRPYFSVHQNGVLLNTHGVTGGQAHRAGQGGEDDVGCQLAATRVYFNIGMCAGPCMLPNLTNGPGGGQSPINLATCSAACADLVAEQKDVADECSFINDAVLTPPPSLAFTAGGARYLNISAATAGEKVFQTNCASCHSNGDPLWSPRNVYSDDQVHVASGFNATIGEPAGDVGTNACRSRTTNWETGQIWAEFSSDELKERGPGYYRDVPLYGIWATAPFFHNNRLGPASTDPSVGGRVAAFESAFNELMNPPLRNEASSVLTTTVAITIATPAGAETLPAGTPVGAFANVNPATGQSLCSDYVENGGHYFGATLDATDKANLGEFLKTL
jgi:hypothetical protein